MTQSRFARIDLSQVPRPDALEDLAYEGLLAARMEVLVAKFQATGISYNVGALESDPAKILQEADAEREIIVRARVNDAVLATSLIFASGHDLDVRAAEYHTVRAANERDASLRLRAILAWEALSLGGSYGGYEYFARSAAPVDILDVQIYGHEISGVAKGEVRIVILGAGGQGTTPPAVIRAVQNAFPRPARKVNDLINVTPSNIVAYQVDADLILPLGADPATVVAARKSDLVAYTTTRGVIGGLVTVGGILGALGHNDPNVIGVDMRSPFTGQIDLSNPPTIGGNYFVTPVCTGISVNFRLAS